MRVKMRTCVCNPAALKAAEELHARSKYSTSVKRRGGEGSRSRDNLASSVLSISVNLNPKP